MVIPPEIRQQLTDHARDELPNEACGILVLQDAHAVRYVRGRNAAASPCRFDLHIDADVWFLEDDGYQLAVFHSHPRTPARPSPADVERIGLWEGRPYVILRADTDELQTWRIISGNAEPEGAPG